ncbi:MAG: ABC-F family ATP-binding cassette domain-containing protein, partial [Sphaerochaetaceae bacterium]|nr:ABC-F family ATP-binding cassette domain-containing protein [Sphaerochaetaceae bacterium]
MILLSVENISKTLKDGPLFQEVTFGMERGDRIGLVGPNGCGKSTFLRLLSGSLESDTGTIAKARNLSLALLEQQPQFLPGQTVGDFLLDGEHPTIQLLRQYHQLLRAKDVDHEVLHQVMEEIEVQHGWDIQTRYTSFLSELQGPPLDASMEILSGGMFKKVAIARTFAANPDLVLLDEPTNHLDIPTIQWLEQYLVNATISVILVTHDRYLLDHVCTTILEFDRGKVYSHPGSYTQFLERRSERLSSMQAEQERLKTVLRREMEWLARGPRARTGKDSGRKSRIATMQESLISNQAQMADFTSLQRRMGKKVLELKAVGKTYANTEVLQPFSHSFVQGERIGLIGPNGSGKTTLLEMIAMRTEPTVGMVEVGVNTAFGYYDQTDSPMDHSQSVLGHITEIAEEVTLGVGQTLSAPRFLELFGFPTSFHRLPIGTLSGGERRRLYLVSVLMQAPNFLLLDEPTNDLDIDTIRRLEEYLLEFSGCVLVVSHDRAFLDRVVDTLFVFADDGTIVEFAGNFSDYQAEKVAVAVKEVEEIEKPKRVIQRQKKVGLTFKEGKEL